MEQGRARPEAPGELTLDFEQRPVLLVELGKEAGFPREILPHRVAVAGVPVVNEEEMIDAFRIRRIGGGGNGRVAVTRPSGESAIEQLHICEACLKQVDCRQPRDFRVTGHQHN